MKNNNDEAMKNYFDSMLRSEALITPPVDIHQEADMKPESHEVSVLPQALVFSNSSTEMTEQLTSSGVVEKENDWKNIDVEDEFQVLFFELNGMTFAVPLTDLGGIHHLDDTLNFLMGKPAWFSGVMNNHDRLYNIVNTSLWLQLDHHTENIAYSHYVILGNTTWGLSCEKLLGTESLLKSQVRWRESKGSRPWLAGMVKKKMCALIHVNELVKLLNQGMDIRG